MKLAATCACFAQIVFVIVELFKSGWPDNGRDSLVFAVLSIVPVLSILAIRQQREGTGFLALWIKRKRLEEAEKIRTLEAGH